MPRKKKEEQEEAVVTEVAETETEATEEAIVETAAEAGESIEVASETVATVEETNAPDDLEGATEEVPAKSKAKAEPKSVQPESVTAVKQSKRAERVGVVSSDKMTKTVVVRVDRLIKHPIYRKYVKRRKNFMAHDELGAGIGDKVRIVETRPLSARKRWRVVEIIQKAEK
jgi:small subunit ribosomal protein S17